MSWHFHRLAINGLGWFIETLLKGFSCHRPAVYGWAAKLAQKFSRKLELSTIHRTPPLAPPQRGGELIDNFFLLNLLNSYFTYCAILISSLPTSLSLSSLLLYAKFLIQSHPRV
jgi:hypothetical protein